MSLSDRLADAARQRAGAPTADPGAVRTRRRQTTRELTVILGAHIPASTVEPDPDADADSICPSCGRTGQLGILDLGRQTSDWTCVACGTLWRVAAVTVVHEHR